jgi:N-acetylglutamate synthase-like GNAT family acetyltransferase
MPIIYRKAVKQDIETIRELLKELGYDVDGRTLSRRIAAIRDQGGEVIVASINGLAVGCVNTIIDIRLAEGLTGEIVSLVVSAMHRGEGIGKGLVSHAEAWLKTKGCNRIRVRANAVRKEAHRFYLKLGFKEIKTQKIFTKSMPIQKTQ